jgi:hypothetical protein
MVVKSLVVLISPVALTGKTTFKKISTVITFKGGFFLAVSVKNDIIRVSETLRKL